MTGINAIIYVASTIPPYVTHITLNVCAHRPIRWILVDRWGRRAILLSGAVVVCAHLLALICVTDLVWQMAISLGLTGWWMYIDVPATPNAVVICVIIYNAAFGYRYVVVLLVMCFICLNRLAGAPSHGSTLPKSCPLQ
jgi:hypothetical protein